MPNDDARSGGRLNAADAKLAQMLRPEYALCRDDVVWMLEYIRKTLAEAEASAPVMSPAELLRQFRCFAEVALMLIRRGPAACDREIELLRASLRDNVFSRKTPAAPL